jgi:hypothetical protein
MNRLHKVFLGVALINLLVAGVYSLGGFHHNRYSRYDPSSGGSGPPKFRLDIYPKFTSGGSSKNYIPNLISVGMEACSSPHVFLDLPYYGKPGYEGLRSLTLDSVTISSVNGTTIPLITHASVRTFDLPHTEFVGRSEDLGPVEGDKLTIFAEGSTLADSGESHRFTFEQTWTVTRSTRSGLGVVFGE